MRLSIVALIVILVVGAIVVSAGFLTNQNEDDVKEVVSVVESQYEKLEKYKNELERINIYNQQVLDDLEEKAKSVTNEDLDQINEEIQTIKRVINENNIQLEEIIDKLSEMEPDT